MTPKTKSDIAKTLLAAADALSASKSLKPQMHDLPDTFWLVFHVDHPAAEMVDVLAQADIGKLLTLGRGGVKAADIAGVYADKALATRAAKEALQAAWDAADEASLPPQDLKRR